MMRHSHLLLRSFMLVFSAASTLPAAELAVLGPDNWDAFAPQGKEVDCIYGDFLLQNERIVAVIARPVAGRNANMTVRNVGGAVIDLTRRDRQSDQLSAFYPGGKATNWRASELEVDGKPALFDEQTHVRKGAAVSVICRAAAAPDSAEAVVRYTLNDGDDSLLVTTTYTNSTEQPLDITQLDEVRADGSFEKMPNGTAPLFWVYDKWFQQAYGFVAEGTTLAAKSDAKNSTLTYSQGDSASVKLKPDAKLTFERRLFPAATLLEVRSIANRLAGIEQRPIELQVKDTAGHPLAAADVEVRDQERPYAYGRTDEDGRLKFELPPGQFRAQVTSPANGAKTVELSEQALAMELPEAGSVSAHVTGEDGGPMPCKVQFLGREGTADPDFGHQTGEWAVRSVYYSENGRFSQPLPPGKYQAIVSHGPEYDAAFIDLEIRRGAATPLTAVLVRSVQTPGWVSADFHSHSSPSGDNTSSQLGRVLNLLCEHVEFAPCTEHNRLSTYLPHLERLKARHLMATCTGIELTDNPGDVNHHNAFPLVRHAHTQDDGAPLSDADMEVKIERLALWDAGSEKLVQQNHPDIGHLFYDKNGDGQPDGGFQKAFGFMDVIEVHPPHTILQSPASSSAPTRNNTIFNWLQLLNQGYRIPGVVNTDAHYNFHGSGFLRIYLESESDDPARTETLDMVHAAEHGHIVMTSGPYLEVVAVGGEASNQQRATAGDDLSIPGGKARLKVRVQCPNWFDIDRVQVFLNGRPEPSLNFTRATTPERFTGGTVKFEQELPLALAGDTHVIVVAAAEKSTLGPVMGPEHAKDMPIAVSNPIYLDVDGGGFKANRDTLGAPLPVMAGRLGK
ncbi:MAG TPA: CehA/McbA family metallohydrolase [Pirellulales bacterium]|nr:CehA/McbA family metallohydrolase [Pirellulales bacterium]